MSAHQRPWTARQRRQIALATGVGAATLFGIGLLGGTQSMIALYGRPAAALLLGALALRGTRSPVRLLAAWFVLLAVGTGWGVLLADTTTAVRVAALAGALILCSSAIVLWRLPTRSQPPADGRTV